MLAGLFETDSWIAACCMQNYVLHIDRFPLPFIRCFCSLPLLMPVANAALPSVPENTLPHAAHAIPFMLISSHSCAALLCVDLLRCCVV